MCNWVGTTSCHRGEQYSILYSQKFFHMCLQKKRGWFLNNLYEIWKSLVTLQLTSNHSVVFWTTEYEKKILLLFVQTYRKTKKVLYIGITSDNDRKRKESPYMETSRDNEQKNAYIGNEMLLQKYFLTLIHKSKSPFSHQHSISFTHGLQHYRFLGQANLYRLCELWQTSRQIWTFFWVQKWFQILGCKTQSIQKRWQQRVPTGPKFYNGRSSF